MREIVWQIAGESGESRPHPADADSARLRLVEGNDAFAEMFAADGDDGRRLVQLAPEELGISTSGEPPKQEPFASVLSCADARVPGAVAPRFVKVCAHRPPARVMARRHDIPWRMRLGEEKSSVIGRRWRTRMKREVR